MDRKDFLRKIAKYTKKVCSSFVVYDVFLEPVRFELIDELNKYLIETYNDNEYTIHITLENNTINIFID